MNRFGKIVVCVAALGFFACFGPRSACGDPIIASAKTSGGAGNGPATGSDWILNAIGLNLWNVTAETRFGHPAPGWGGFIGPVASPAAGYLTAGGTTRLTPKINDPDGSGAFGQAQATVNVLNPGIGKINFNYSLFPIVRGVTGPPPAAGSPHDVHTIAKFNDPTGFTVGSAGTSLSHDHSLFAGTQVLSAFIPELGSTPELLLEGRFGLGAFQADPEALWRDTPPGGIFDLYRISIFEDANHQIDASVSFFSSPTPDFSVAFAASSASIKAAIRGANWTLDGALWTLNEDLSLVDLNITNINAAHFGSDATIGVRATNEAVAVVPEPSTFVFVSLGAFSLLGYGWRRRIRP